MTAPPTVTEPPRKQKVDSKVQERDLLAALPAKSASREVRVGAFVLLGVVAFAVALFSLTDVGTFRGRYYATTIIETAGGMRNGDPVQMRGVNIGRVAGFDMVQDGVAVRMEIYNQYEVPEDSRVNVRSAGLLGGMLVDIVPGNSTQRIGEDQELPGTVEGDIMSSAGGLTGQAEVVLDRASTLLSPETVGGVGTSVSEMQILIAELRGLVGQQRQELAGLTQSLRRSAAGIEGAATAPALEQAIANTETLTARLDNASVSLETASTSLELVLGRIERGEGTLGRLTVDESLYDNLNATAVSVRALADDIQANPRKYIDVRVF